MKKNMLHLITLGILIYGLSFGCKKSDDATESDKNAGGGMSGLQDDVSQKDILKIAAGSKDHTTLVVAVKAAGLEDALANPGPFTVFAPTDAAFAKIPKETIETLLKPENKGDLENILYHHVLVGVFKAETFTDGEQISMFDGTPATIGIKDGKITVDDANVIATIPASNGIIHVVDTVVLPKKK
ncbi:MAG: fasciclin domain-containing protein [Leptospiraceae bacterium]|nr:fasciclin domain-containing protein [Leptospiraceae bacterium]